MFRWFPISKRIAPGEIKSVVWFFRRAVEAETPFKRGYYCGNAVATAAKHGPTAFLRAYEFSDHLQRLEKN